MKFDPKNKFFLVLAIFITLPFIVPFIINDAVIITLVNIGTILGFLYYARTRVKNLAGNLLGSKITWMCMACTKIHNQGACPGCGSKMRKPT